ncbi:MAG: ComF family protein [Patescibacteria group bacterium]
MNLRNLLDLIFPTNCFHCGEQSRNGASLCAKCFSAIPLNRKLFCGKCGARLALNKKVCHKGFLYVLGAATNYDGATKELVWALKFKSIKSAAEELGELLVRYAVGLNFDLKNFVVVPIPLSKKRLRERGFNQAELIARKFASYFGLPLSITSLSRLKHAKPQSEAKNIDERKENVLGSFHAQGGLAGKNVILIDDVLTSGATMLAAAEALKSAGVKRIIALTVARA